MSAGLFNGLVSMRHRLWAGWVHCCAKYGMYLACLGASLVLPGVASAEPPVVSSSELAKLSDINAHASVDLRHYWQTALVNVNGLPHTQPSDPKTLWSLPDAQFTTTAQPERTRLTQGQRYVARMNMVSSGFGANINLSFLMPRLDAVHLAYRYDQDPWVVASAGDTIAMNDWAFRDRQPSFDIPLRPGNLHILIEIAHLGMVDTAIMLQSANVYRDDRLFMGLSIGALVGINLVFALVGIGAALAFQRWSFLAVTAMTALTAAVISTNSGMAGVYLLTHSAVFNDQAKFFTNTLWCALFPWVAATALSQKLHALAWWRASQVFAVVGLVFTIWAMDYALRSVMVKWVPIIALLSVAFALAILMHALLRKQAHALSTAPAVLFYACALLIPLAAYQGLVPNDSAILYSAIATMLAALLFLQVLVRQHRHGRLVMARAKTSPGRDVLTGLLSRNGFEQILARDIKRMKVERMYAAFFYIRVSDAQTLKDRYGDEGFEVGMVQLAAALSSSISVADSVGRVAPNAFAVTVLMQRDANVANGLAQKILTRTMALASHGAPLAQTARIAVAWLPTFGTLLPDIERRCLRAIHKMEQGKRIVWVGGANAQADASMLPDGLSSAASTKPHNGQEADEELPSLPGVINRLQEEMLGPDTQTLTAEADRLMRKLQAKISANAPLTRQ
jgi:GGDEF domain-containing protein